MIAGFKVRKPIKRSQEKFIGSGNRITDIRCWRRMFWSNLLTRKDNLDTILRSTILFIKKNLDFKNVSMIETCNFHHGLHCVKIRSS